MNTDKVSAIVDEVMGLPLPYISHSSTKLTDVERDNLDIAFRAFVCSVCDLYLCGNPLHSFSLERIMGIVDYIFSKNDFEIDRVSIYLKSMGADFLRALDDGMDPESFFFPTGNDWLGEPDKDFVRKANTFFNVLAKLDVGADNPKLLSRSFAHLVRTETRDTPLADMDDEALIRANSILRSWFPIDLKVPYWYVRHSSGQTAEGTGGVVLAREHHMYPHGDDMEAILQDPNNSGYPLSALKLMYFSPINFARLFNKTPFASKEEMYSFLSLYEEITERFAKYASGGKIVETDQNISRPVHKDANKARIISFEKSINMAHQLAALESITRVVNVTPFLRKCVNFNDQGRQRELAVLGSSGKNQSTLDLKEASDLLDAKSVLSLLEGTALKLLLENTRTERTVLSSSHNGTDEMVLRKLSPMGSGTTFPVQTIVFAALICAAWEVSTSLSYTDPRFEDFFGVFGDDISIPSFTPNGEDFSEVVISLFFRFGLRVNKDKSFTGIGHFRESCGIWAYNGQDVTPFRYSRKSESKLATGSARDLARLIAMHNNALVRGSACVANMLFRYVRDFPVEQLPKNFSWPQLSNDPSDGSAIYDPDELKVFKSLDSGFSFEMQATFILRLALVPRLTSSRGNQRNFARDVLQDNYGEVFSLYISLREGFIEQTLRELRVDHFDRSGDRMQSKVDDRISRLIALKDFSFWSVDNANWSDFAFWVQHYSAFSLPDTWVHHRCTDDRRFEKVDEQQVIPFMEMPRQSVKLFTEWWNSGGWLKIPSQRELYSHSAFPNAIARRIGNSMSSSNHETPKVIEVPPSINHSRHVLRSGESEVVELWYKNPACETESCKISSGGKEVVERALEMAREQHLAESGEAVMRILGTDNLGSSVQRFAVNEAINMAERFVQICGEFTREYLRDLALDYKRQELDARKRKASSNLAEDDVEASLKWRHYLSGNTLTSDDTKSGLHRKLPVIRNGRKVAPKPRHRTNLSLDEINSSD
jgi:hypothetical protein